MNEIKRAELLAPACDPVGLKGVINAGCDAVYLGGKSFSARVFAGNFSDSELLEAIEYAHIRGVRVHLTLNTLLKNRETGNVYSFLKPLYEKGLDAVLVQDLGVLSLVRKYFPELPVHASTQMSVTSAEGARFLGELGVSRVVTARELSLKEIRDIKEKTGMEVECFIHGSLCYCYSGKCLMSSIFGGRSGNRGRCAQPCRLPYDLISDGKKINRDDERYLLSPKDICTAEILPELLGSGIDSLKIEGRMKRPEYAAGIVSVYRECLDRYYSGGDYFVTGEEKALLTDLYNRDGFSKGYYFGPRGRDMLSLERKRAEGKEKDLNSLYERINKKYINTDSRVAITGKAYFAENEPSRLSVRLGDKVYECAGKSPERSKNRPVDRDRILKQLKKTGNSDFVFEDLELRCEDDLYINIRDINELRRDALAGLKDVICKGRVCDAEPGVGKRNDGSAVHGSPDNTSVSGKEQLIYISVSSPDQLKAVTREMGADAFILSALYIDTYPVKDCEDLKDIRDIAGTVKIYAELPFVFGPGSRGIINDVLKAGVDGVVVNDTDTLGYVRGLCSPDMIIAGPYLYTMNDESTAFVREYCGHDSVPYELNCNEAAHRNNSLSILDIYGYIPLMITAGYYKKTYIEDDAYLIDRKGERFRNVSMRNSGTGLIFNSRPLMLFDEIRTINSLKVHGLRLSFTCESPGECGNICRMFRDMYINDRGAAPECQYTKGHFRRGVE